MRGRDVGVAQASGAIDDVEVGILIDMQGLAKRAVCIQRNRNRDLAALELRCGILVAAWIMHTHDGQALISELVGEALGHDQAGHRGLIPARERHQQGHVTLGQLGGLAGPVGQGIPGAGGEVLEFHPVELVAPGAGALAHHILRREWSGNQQRRGDGPCASHQLCPSCDPDSIPGRGSGRSAFRGTHICTTHEPGASSPGFTLC